MNTSTKRRCNKCGTENVSEAKFCINCGQPLTISGNKKNKSERIKRDQGFLYGLNSYMVLGIAFIFAVVVVLLVLNSNRETLYNKLNSGRNQQTTAQNDAVQEKIRELNLQLLQNPEDFQLNVQIANSYFDVGDFQKAISHYQKALSINATDPNVFIDLGVSYFNLNQTELALQYIEKALQINPQHIQGLFNAGIVHYNLGNYQAAINVWEKLVSTHENTPEAARASQFIEDVKQQLNES